MNELLDIVRQVTGLADLAVRYENFRAGEIHTTWCDITKASETFGFAPNTVLAKGLSETWASFQSLNNT